MSDNDSRKPGASRAMPVTRRVVLKTGAAITLSAMVPLVGCGSSPGQPGNADGSTTGPANPPDNPTARASFLNDKQRESLAAFVDRLIPADTDPGALAAEVAVGIDAYLAAFLTAPAFIYAGAPFSDRGGHPTNEFLAFVPLDAYEEFAWRIVIEGSAGIPEREFNGPVKGLQQIYREGIEQIDIRAAEQGAACFAELSAAQRDAIINDGSDAVVQELLDVAFPDTLNFFYGAPEYGGNRNLAGWGFTAWDGDVHPTGYSDEQVINADDARPTDALLPASYSETASNRSRPTVKSISKGTTPRNAPVDDSPITLAVAPSADHMAALIAHADGRLSKLREQMRDLAELQAKGSPAQEMNNA